MPLDLVARLGRQTRPQARLQATTSSLVAKFGWVELLRCPPVRCRAVRRGVVWCDGALGLGLGSPRKASCWLGWVAAVACSAASCGGAWWAPWAGLAEKGKGLVWPKRESVWPGWNCCAAVRCGVVLCCGCDEVSSDASGGTGRVDGGMSDGDVRWRWHMVDAIGSPSALARWRKRYALVAVYSIKRVKRCRTEGNGAGLG